MMTDERLEELRDLARGTRNAHDDHADELSELLAEVDRLRGDRAKLLQVIGTYIDLRNNHPQIAGEGWRDLTGTYHAMHNPEQEQQWGWPAVERRLKEAMEAIREENKRLRAKYEPPPTILTTIDGGTFDPATQTLRVPLATWLERGPQWVVDFRDLARVELTDRKPWHWVGEYGWATGLKKSGLDFDLIVHHMTGGTLTITPHMTRTADRRYASAADAFDALSAALIAWAKEQTP